MKVLNFGSCNVDYRYQVPHLVQPGETLHSLERFVGCGGKGLNQSIAAARAGVTVCHACLIGADAEFLLEKLNDSGVDTSLMCSVPEPNGHAIIQVDSAGRNSIILFGGTNQHITREYADSVLAQFSRGDILILQNEINLIPYIMERAAEKGMRIVFNAAPFHEDVKKYPLHLVEWLIVNEVEGGGLSGESGFDSIVSALRRRYPDSNVLLTMGKAGCICSAGNQRIHVGACKVDAVDTTAAGDTFIGYFVRGLCQGMEMEQILKYASAASALSVTRYGAADSVPLFEEVVRSGLADTL